MIVDFYKYHGTGNDFIILDNRLDNYSDLTTEQIAFLCDRHFGIGADGFIMLQEDVELDFKMRYFNSDGKEASMCGNGGRCIVSFANKLGLVNESVKFRASDGIHKAFIFNNKSIRLQMQDVEEITDIFDSVYLNTGSPHYVSFTNKLDETDVYNQGRMIRYDSEHFPEGTNVNFVELLNRESIRVRTYERGVENETLSCGTGVIASSLAAYSKFKVLNNEVNVETRGGRLKVKFNPVIYDDNNISFNGILLTGPTKLVFKGQIEI